MSEPHRTAPTTQGPGRFDRVSAWIRRRDAVSSALRGAAYGAGAVGLAFWWLRQWI
ncbi:hypothetical protein ACFXAE_06165 [Streptomyces sp. NPDC059454]|uniref:hypothetical protein n=1 Tax=Streptomyces sp. NPDC059454 TaxID=3346836 RepID=UPI0036D0E250